MTEPEENEQEEENIDYFNDGEYYIKYLVWSLDFVDKNRKKNKNKII